LFARNFEREINEAFGFLRPSATSCFGAREQEFSTESNETEERDNTINDTRTSKLRTKRIFPWTRVHSHFALMGGFAFDSSTSLINIIPDGRTRLTLTVQGLRKIAANEPDLIPDISEQIIQDKSKSDGFAKLLVCLQACWFIVQTIGRLATGSAISLLEMSTLLHAVCCLATYMAWWDKPYNIEEPVTIKTEDRAGKICAWLVVDSRLGRCLESDVGPNQGLKVSKHRHESTSIFSRIRRRVERPLKAEFLQLVHDENLQDDEFVSRRPFISKDHIQEMYEYNAARRRPDVLEISDEAHRSLALQSQPISLKLYLGQKIYGFRLLPAQPFDQYSLGRYVRLSLNDLECLRLANSLRTEPNAGQLWEKQRIDLIDDQDGVAVQIYVTNSYNDHLRDFQGSNWLSRRIMIYADFIFWAGLLIAGSVYGGIHLLAWNGPFATEVERWMWRSSCIALVGAMPIIVLRIPSVYLVMMVEEHFMTDDNLKNLRWTWEKLKDLLSRLFHTHVVLEYIAKIIKLTLKVFEASAIELPVLAYSMAYIGGRVYLMVECFMNLAHLPSEVYKEPEWSQYIPHFGSG
jgi:hypothetical protein